jgi:hypothetical protein
VDRQLLDPVHDFRVDVLVALGVIHCFSPRTRAGEAGCRVTPRWRTVGALLVLLFADGGFYWKLTISREWTCLEGPDLANVVRPWLDSRRASFTPGRLPLWDPYEWGGHTLIARCSRASPIP